MTRLIETELEHVKDDDGKEIQGKWAIEVPNNLSYGTYPFSIEYDGSDDNNPEAFQYAGQFVVGKRPYFTVPSAIYYDPNLNSFTINCSVEDKTKTPSIPAQYLPLKIKFIKGQFNDYLNHDDLLNSDFDNVATAITGKYLYYTTNSGSKDTNGEYVYDEKNTSYGKISVSFNNSELYGNDKVNYLNTCFIKCEGTIDRAVQDNYRPNMVAVPVITAQRPTHLILGGIINHKFQEYIGDDSYARGVHGSGNISLTIKHVESFIYNDDGSIKGGYESYTSDDSKQIYDGYYTIQEYIDDSWVDVPGERLIAVNGGTHIDDGRITHDYGTGNAWVLYTNNKSPSYRGNLYIRVKYKGVTGLTNDIYSSAYKIKVDYTDETYSDTGKEVYGSDETGILHLNVDTDTTYLTNTTNIINGTVSTLSGDTENVDGTLTVTIDKLEE